jgi:F-type H+-transporting ATPase subunit a
MQESLFTLSQSFASSAAEGEGLAPWGIFAYSGIVIGVILALIFAARAGMKGRVFRNPVTLMAEQAYLFAENLCVSVIGEHGRKYTPLILGLWLLIFVANVVGLLLPHTPTADWSLNLGLALVVLGYVQWEGMSYHYAALRAKGRDPVTAGVLSFFMHVRHFAGPNLGNLLMMIFITPLIFAIELISEMIKILSLSVRLYGNINAGHVAKHTLDDMAWGLGALILPLEFLVCIIQAFVFVLLTCVYLALTLHHEHDEHEHPHGGHETATATAH